MKFLILAALVAVAVADYHDDTFHFTTLGGGATLTGFKSAGLQTTGLARVSKQYTAQAASPVYSFSAQPAYTQKYSAAVAQPAYTQKYSAAVVQPAYTQKYSAAVVQPAYTQKYSAAVAQPAYTQQYSAAVAQPAYTQKYSAAVVQPAYTQQYSAAVVQPAYTQKYSAAVAQPAYTQQYSALSGASSFSSASSAPQFRILSQVQESDPAGPYKLSYSTENGIQVSEQGALSNGAEGAVVATQGSYSYTGPDGQVYTVNWVADENGYRATGDHLPVPPPIPAEILKSLEEISRSGNKFDEQGRLFRK